MFSDSLKKFKKNFFSSEEIKEFKKPIDTKDYIKIDGIKKLKQRNLYLMKKRENNK